MFLNFSMQGFNLATVVRYKINEFVGHPEVSIWFIGDEEPLILVGKEAICFIGYVTRHPTGIFPVDEIGE